MRCRLLTEQERSPTTPDDWRYFEQHGHFQKLPPGTVIIDPQAYMLVRLGIAVADDEECERNVRMSMAQLDRARYAAQRVGLGIHPDDYAAYDAGKMQGYNPDGSWVPGPNYSEGDDE